MSPKATSVAHRHFVASSHRRCCSFLFASARVFFKAAIDCVLPLGCGSMGLSSSVVVVSSCSAAFFSPVVFVPSLCFVCVSGATSSISGSSVSSARAAAACLLPISCCSWPNCNRRQGSYHLKPARSFKANSYFHGEISPVVPVVIALLPSLFHLGPSPNPDS